MLGVPSSVTSSCDITHKLVSNKGSAIFDGTNDFIDASSVANDLNLNTGTISLWARVTTTDSNESFFNVSDGTSGNDKLVLMYKTSSSLIKANYKAGGTNQEATHSISNSDIVSAGWFHVVMTYDTTADEVKLYYNGSLVNTRSSSLTAIDAETVSFDTVLLGKSANADNTYQQGYIDEYAYFARVLSASEITRIYNEKGKFNYAEDLDLTGSANALKQWLRFGDGSVGGVGDQTTGIIDMSNATLGSELVTNGGFAANSDFDFIGNATISGGTGNFSGGANSFIIQTSVIDASVKFYQLKYELLESNGATFRLSGGNSAFGTVILTNTVGVHTVFLKSNGTKTSLQLNGTTSFVGTIDNVSLKEVNGNLAFTSGALINQNNLPG